jgi:hypothetical protein
MKTCNEQVKHTSRKSDFPYSTAHKFGLAIPSKFYDIYIFAFEHIKWFSYPGCQKVQCIIHFSFSPQSLFINVQNDLNVYQFYLSYCKHSNFFKYKLCTPTFNRTLESTVHVRIPAKCLATNCIFICLKKWIIINAS